MNKKAIIIIAIVLIIAIVVAVVLVVNSDKGGQSVDNGYKKITAKEAKEMMDKGGVTVVDVRSYEEYEAGHIENAIILPVDEIDNTKPVKLPDYDATILVYCRSGNRSRAAAMQLIKLGYKNVYDFGGIIDWPYEIVT